MSISGSQLIYDFLSQPTEAPFVDPAWSNIETTFQNTNTTGLRASGFATASMKLASPATSSLIKSKITISTNQSASSDPLAPIIFDNSTGAGYLFICNGTNGRITKRTTGTGIGSTLGTSFTISAIAGDEYELWYDKSNGLLSAVVNNSVISTQTDTQYQASTLAVGVLSDPQNNNGRRIGVFAADYLAIVGPTINNEPSNIRVTEPRTIRFTNPTSTASTVNVTIKIDDIDNAAIFPDSVTNVSGLTYDAVFTTPDAYAGLPYSATGYPVIVTTTDGSVTSGNVDFLPVTGNDYVTATAVPGDFTVTSGTLAIGDQIEYETLSGDISVSSALDVTYTGADPTGLSFDARAWDDTDDTWGSWATISLEDALNPGGGGSAENPLLSVGILRAGLTKRGLW